MNKDEFDKMTERLYTADTYVSPDFQSDLTGGFPASLCVNWDEGKAWLMLNESLVMDRDDMELNYYRQLCADYGIRQCYDIEQYNNLLRDLGEDAIHSAELFDDNIKMGEM